MIQDDIREIELVNLFGLKKTNHNRIDTDASLKCKNKIYEFEIKSTTIGDVSTASPMTIDHINKWRNKHWIIGVYNNQEKLETCYYGSPDDMKDWLDHWETDIQRGYKISDMIVEKIDNEMLFSIFGKKTMYSVEELKVVFKKLFSTSQYDELKNKSGYISVKNALKLFKEHNKKYLYRGSYINNPKIPKKYYSNWLNINDNHKKAIRKIF